MTPTQIAPTPPRTSNIPPPAVPSTAPPATDNRSGNPHSVVDPTPAPPRVRITLESLSDPTARGFTVTQVSPTRVVVESDGSEVEIEATGGGGLVTRLVRVLPGMVGR